MKVKTKIFLSFGFMFLIILLLGVIGSYYVNKLGNDAAEILKENHRTLEYMQNIDNSLDKIERSYFEDSLFDPSAYSRQIIENLELQKQNVTETGERELTKELEEEINFLFNEIDTSSSQQIFTRIFNINEITERIYDINNDKILFRNQQVAQTSSEIYLYMLIISSCAFILGLFITVGFPNYIIGPIKKLTKAIKEVSYGNYDVEVVVKRNDEFRYLASSFNVMALKLKEFEKSNYSQILFEKKRLDSIINQLSEAIVGLDDGKRVIFANKRALSLLGMAEREVKGKYAPDIAVNNNLMQELIGEVMTWAGDENYKIEKPLKITEGKKEKLFSKEIVNVLSSPTGKDKKQLIGHVIFLQDITDFARRDQAKTHFMATLSHELKTPVAAIEMGTDLLLNTQTGALNDEQQEWLKVVVANNERIRRIINEILDLSQIESGSIDIFQDKIEVNDIIEPAIEGVTPFLTKKRINVEKEIELGKEKVFADPQKIVWVINNFLTNAIRYSSQGSSILIKSVSETYHVKISVIDTGKGISSEEKSQLFEPFSKKKREESGGTGLGLSISKEFVEAMGGTIGVTSKKGEGAEFWIRLKKVY
jgi:PAS domain S-box-containing protein